MEGAAGACRNEVAAPCALLALTEVKALAIQDRSFGFAVLQLVIGRMLENNERLLQPGTA